MTRLARSLVKFLLENKNIGHTGKDNIFKFYHIPLAKEVIDVKAKKLYDGFVKDEHTLSDNAKKFRKSFAEEIKKQSQGKLIIENINEAISKKEKVIESKEIGLNLSKKFGEGKDKNWPNNVIPKDEIEEFLNNLVFAVNQPNEDELGKIIKKEIGEDLDLVTTENTYNKFFITMLNWLQGKERGRFLSYEEGKEFFEKAKRGLPVLFNIKNPVSSFTGRIEQLNNLHEAMMYDGRAIVSQSVSISGLGGVGKSELAKKYISQYSKDYDNKIIWINAESYSTLSESFRRLACDKLGISLKNRDGKEKDIKSIVEDVYRFFSKGKSLFIFDNAEKYRSQREDDDGIDKFLPSLPEDMNKPYILVTSRNTKWPQNVKLLELDVFTPKEATEFIQKALKLENNEQEEDVIKLAETLQYFPLALQQAVAYIKVKNEELKNVGSGFSVDDYLKRYEEKTRELLNFQFPENSDNTYTKTTLTTWKITLDSIKQIEKGDKAIEIMNIIAYFAPDNISTKMFFSLISNKEDLGSAIKLLKQYSIVSSSQEQTALNIHRLVQQVTRINLKERDEEKNVLEKALKLFDAVDSNNVGHAVSIWSCLDNYQRLIEDYAWLPSHITNCLRDNIRYKEANIFSHKALVLLKGTVGEGHTLTLQHNIATLLAAQGKHRESKKMFEMLRTLEEKDNVSSSLSEMIDTQVSLATQYSELSEYDKAQQIYKTLLSNSNILTEKNRTLIVAWHDYAMLLSDLGKNNQALEILYDILNRRIEVLGVAHEDTLLTKSSIAHNLLIPTITNNMANNSQSKWF